MGWLHKFNLNDFIDNENKIKVFVETGTNTGVGLAFAAQHNFDKLYSIEIMENLYTQCVNKFKGNNKINLIHDDSINGLVKIMSELSDEPTLYWLDAHLPNEYDKSYSADYDKDREVVVPLEKELLTIKENKDVSKDVFILDDLRVYEEGPYEMGNYGDVHLVDKNKEGIKFVTDILGETHNIEKDFRDSGYIICTPKEDE